MKVQFPEKHLTLDGILVRIRKGTILNQKPGRLPLTVRVQWDMLDILQRNWLSAAHVQIVVNTAHLRHLCTKLLQFPVASASYSAIVVREISNILYQLSRFHISALYFHPRDFKKRRSVLIYEIMSSSSITLHHTSVQLQVKISLFVIKYHVLRACGGSAVQRHAFITSKLDGDEFSASLTGLLNHKETSPHYLRIAQEVG